MVGYVIFRNDGMLAEHWYHGRLDCNFSISANIVEIVLMEYATVH